MIVTDEQGKQFLVVPLENGQDDLTLFRKAFVDVLKAQFLGKQVGDWQHNANYRLVLILEAAMEDKKLFVADNFELRDENPSDIP